MSFSLPAPTKNHPYRTSIVWGFALLLVVFFVLPSTVYFYNAKEFTQPLTHYLRQSGIIALCFLPLLLLLSIPACIAKFIRASSIIGIVYLLVMNFILPISFGALDGATLPKISIWTDATILQCMALFFVIVALHYFAPKVVHDLAQLGLIGALAFSSYILMPHLKFNLGEDAQNTPQQQLDVYQTFSKNKNVLLIGLDGIQGNIIARVMRDHPEIASAFTGFHHFTDTVAPAPNTGWSMIATLTGYMPPTGEKGQLGDDVHRFIHDKLFADVMDNQSFQASTNFNIFGYSPKRTLLDIKILMDEELKSQIIGLHPLQVSILRVTPASISWRFLEWSQNKITELNKSANAEINAILADTAAHQHDLDFPLFQKLYENVTLTEQNILKFYFYLFTHEPVTRTSDCRYVGSKGQPQTPKAAEALTLCAMREVSKLLTMLKDQGIYDKSLIVLMSDHGLALPLQDFSQPEAEGFLGEVLNKDGFSILTASRYTPMLMIKPLNAPHSPIKSSSYPATLLDIAPTICAATSKNGACSATQFTGVDLFASTLPQKRNREFMVYVGGKKHLHKVQYDSRTYATFSIDGIARNAIPRQLAQDRIFKCGSVFDLKKQTPENTHVWSTAKSKKSSLLKLPLSNAALAFYSEESSCPQNILHLSIRTRDTAKRLPKEIEITLNGQRLTQLDTDTINGKNPIELKLPFPTNSLEDVRHNIIKILPLDSNDTALDSQIEIHHLGIE